MDYRRLRDFLDANSGTYGALSDADAATEINAVDKSYNVPQMSGKEVKDAFEGNSTEWDALTDANKQIILALTARDDLDPHGIDADIFADAAAGATNTIAALNAARTLTRSDADIQGFGTVLDSHIATARSSAWD